MNRAVIILCAGTSSRFSKSLNQEVLKVIYHENQPTKTILAYQLNSLKNAFNKIIIVGGYRIEELKNYVGDYFSNLEHIEIVNNRKFETDGTGYSFQLGINALKEHYDQVVLLEGDLILDAPSFDAVVSSNNDVITVSPLLIDARTSVIFYSTLAGQLNYLYDQTHTALHIPAPFLTLGNSGQVWKFKDLNRLKAASQLKLAANSTNLRIIAQYFEALHIDNCALITFKKWINCNTYTDYQTCFGALDETTE